MPQQEDGSASDTECANEVTMVAHKRNLSLVALLSPPPHPAAGAGSAAHNESETIAKYEIMDGAPVRGENIPIR